MNANEVDGKTKFRVGIFALMGLLLIGSMTVFVNDKPYWWRKCNLKNISVEDATGLKMKSPVRSLGLQIGYIKAVQLSETHVRLAVCLTAPVEVIPSTRAYIRPEGFLGDQFLELKPVRYIGTPKVDKAGDHSSWSLFPAAHAQEQSSKKKINEIPMGEGNENINAVVKKVDRLVGELGDLTSNLKSAIDPQQLKETMRQLNKTLENAAKTLSPEGGLTTTAQRALAKLEDAIEQMRQVLTRINQGEGSVGKIINDPTIAEELTKAVKNVNALLGRASSMRVVVDAGGAVLPAYDDEGRGWIHVSIWPRPDRYYKLGLATDPRGAIRRTTTTTSAGGVSTTVETTQIEETGLLFTAMLGKVFWHRLDLSLGLIFGDGAIRAGLNLGPKGDEERFQINNTGFVRQLGAGGAGGVNYRLTGVVFPLRTPFISSVYFTGGIDSFRKVDGELNYFYGAGIAFDDNDIKLLFSFL